MAAVAASFANVVSTEDTYLSIRSDTTALRSGDTFSFDIYAVATNPVNAIDVTVAYPDAQMEVLGIDFGESVITLWTEEPEAKNGTILLRGGTFRQGFIGEHFIARIDAKATESGTVKIKISEAQLLAGDGQGTEIALADLGEEEVRLYVANTDGSMVSVVDVAILTDLNGDGEVGMSDIMAFMNAWRNQNVIFDFNGDKQMTFRDFAIILADSFTR